MRDLRPAWVDACENHVITSGDLLDSGLSLISNVFNVLQVDKIN